MTELTFCIHFDPVGKAMPQPDMAYHLPTVMSRHITSLPAWYSSTVASQMNAWILLFQTISSNTFLISSFLAILFLSTSFLFKDAFFLSGIFTLCFYSPLSLSLWKKYFHDEIIGVRAIFQNHPHISSKVCMALLILYMYF